jgi:hypothetical protein
MGGDVMGGDVMGGDVMGSRTGRCVRGRLWQAASTDAEVRR